MRRRLFDALGARRVALPANRAVGMVCPDVLATAVDLRACGRDGPPRSAELVDALPGGLTRLSVSHEVVERVTAVRNLELSVLALRRTEQRSVHAASGDGLAVADQRRPERRAGAVADAGRALVGREVVQRDALAVDEDPAQVRHRDVDARTAGRGAAGERDRGRGGENER